jgi:hypothetical protein
VDGPREASHWRTAGFAWRAPSATLACK